MSSLTAQESRAPAGCVSPGMGPNVLLTCLCGPGLARCVHRPPRSEGGCGSLRHGSVALDESPAGEEEVLHEESQPNLEKQSTTTPPLRQQRAADEEPWDEWQPDSLHLRLAHT